MQPLCFFCFYRCILILLLSVLTLNVKGQWLWEVTHMHTIKEQLTSLSYNAAYQRLLQQADRAMVKPIYSVTQKEGIAPSGNRHDYVSLSRYWWPNPKTANKLPYIYKDGRSNPELEQYDRNRLGDMCAAVNTLSLAYFYSGEEKYAEKAVMHIRGWFMDVDTRMNPNLNYSQFIPGRNGSKGRPEGLIDSYSFVSMLSSIQLLQGSRSYTKQDEIGLKQWFKEFAQWLQTSEQGRAENVAKNNHATAYDVQLATYLLFAGDVEAAQKIIHDFPKKRIFAQIEPDGKQPHELWRTLAYHYSQYNLSHMLDLCATAKSLGIDLLNQESADGRSISVAMDYLVSFLGKDVDSWPYKQISGWEQKQRDVCADLIRVLTLDTSKTHYREVYRQYAEEDITDRQRLLYGAEDMVTDFLSFASSQLQYAMERTDSVYSASDNKRAIIPRSVDKQGKLVLVGPRDWCSGFFPGTLWFMYKLTGDTKWQKDADRYTRFLEGEKDDRTSHDVGFKINCSYGNGYFLTRDPDYRTTMLQAAATLSKRYHKQVGAIRSWDFNRDIWQFPVIIDNMMNLELLFEVARLSGNEHYYQIADAHASTTLAHHFRPDYSSYHVVDYDTISTAIRQKHTHQGFADESAWARGQAWALYGYTMSYRYTRNTDYLEQAEGIAGFIFNNKNLPDDLIPYWDYDDPTIPNAPRDASAACITASALYELASYSITHRRKYTGWADLILTNLMRKYRAKQGGDEGFLLLHSTGHYPHDSEIDVPISYADYYFMEALARRKDLYANQ
ncbi:alginate lyase family protein [Sphingobacterium sp. DN00404]|uniref:Alginate lyase family protein n=2 Tax=Sphingobacterium micropteri TaxID=2763501 RepID=A0ABR7YL04_9SPHI|nr:alginate lyase family protein [Sphingobacterium micropteri]